MPFRDFRRRFRRFAREQFFYYALSVSLLVLAYTVYRIDPHWVGSFTFPWGQSSYEVIPPLLCVLVVLVLFSAVVGIAPDKRHLSLSMIVVGIGMMLTLAISGYIELTKFALTKGGPAGMEGDAALAHTQNLLNLFGVIMGVGAIGATVLGFWIQSRLETLSKLEDRLDEASKLAVVMAENALMNLPPPSQSQQVPQAVARTLSVMNRLIFEDPDHALLKFLEKQGTGARFHLAKALYEYSGTNFFVALEELEKTKRATDREVRLEAIWLRAMVLRQDGQLDKSVKELRVLLGEANRRDDQALKSQVIVGFAIRCLVDRAARR
ncbi:MAG: hypothetical protein DME97_07530 [Verrucomicrobia bacterium]|nr:MAG: hypothetical protein DME97_07530 [Verrucomicrobiota bacterium]